MFSINCYLYKHCRKPGFTCITYVEHSYYIKKLVKLKINKPKYVYRASLNYKIEQNYRLESITL